MLLTELETPAVTIDLDRLEANIRRAQAQLDRHGVANRPHIKTHKIPAIATTASGWRSRPRPAAR